MVKRKMLYQRFGENITTPLDPVREFTEKDLPLLEIEESYCMSYDDNRLIRAKKYEVRDLELPAWVPVESYCAGGNSIKWNLILALPEFGEKLGDKAALLFTLDYEEIKALYPLFKTKVFRSEFRRSLFNQVLQWFNGKNDYRSPLSPRQWNAIMRYSR